MSFAVKNFCIAFAVLFVLFFGVEFAKAQGGNTFFEDFEDYSLTPLAGQGDWLTTATSSVVTATGCPTGQCAEWNSSLGTSATNYIPLGLSVTANFEMSFEVSASTTQPANATPFVFAIGTDQAASAGDVDNAIAFRFFRSSSPSSRFVNFQCQGTNHDLSEAELPFNNNHLYRFTVQYTGSSKSCSWVIQNLTTAESVNFSMSGTSTNALTNLSWTMIDFETPENYVRVDNFQSSAPVFGTPNFSGFPRIVRIDIDRELNASSTVNATSSTTYDNTDGIYQELVVQLFSFETESIWFSNSSTAATGENVYELAFSNLPQDQLFEIRAFLQNPVQTPWSTQTVPRTRTFSTDMAIDHVFDDPEWQPCSLTQPQGCLVNAGLLLFYPSSGAVTDITTSMQDLLTKAPFGYASEFQSLLDTALGAENDYTLRIASSTIPWLDEDIVLFSRSLIEDSAFFDWDLIHNIMIFAVYFGLAAYFYERAIGFRVWDV